MKTLKTYLTEGRKKTKKQTFGDFFCWYNGCDSIDDFTEDNFKTGDVGFLFGRTEDDFKTFIEWVKEHENDIVTVHYDDYDTNIEHGVIWFNLKKERIELDWEGEISDIM